MFIATIAVMIWWFPFELHLNFSDLQQIVKTEHGEIPYGAYHYQQLIDECFVISKTINTSYTDLMDISIREKERMLEIIMEDNKKQQEEIEKIKRKTK